MNGIHWKQTQRKGKAMARCPDCGPFFDSIGGTCPLCGQVVEFADEDEVMEAEPFDLAEGGAWCEHTRC